MENLNPATRGNPTAKNAMELKLPEEENQGRTALGGDHGRSTYSSPAGGLLRSTPLAGPSG
eukprot:359772-Alexandrium_andersonii.AAC.1